MTYSCRQQTGGPIKRVVQPKIIHLDSSSALGQPISGTDVITTAAVAASAAITATQPFLTVCHNAHYASVLCVCFLVIS